MKKIILSALLLLFTACATNAYNIPFVNVDETIQLREGMSKHDVLDKMGDPYYVQSGENGVITWIYEIRAIEVLSDSGGDDVIPRKTHANQRDTNPIHKLEVVFVNNKVKIWNRVHEEKENKPMKSLISNKKPSTTKTIKSKSSAMAISPFLQLGNAGGFGMSLYKNNLGISFSIHPKKDPFDVDDEPDVSAGAEYDSTSGNNFWSYRYESPSGASLMLMYKKDMKSFVCELGLGMSSITTNIITKYQGESEYNSPPTKEDLEGDEDGGTDIYIKLGVGKNFNVKNFQLSPMIYLTSFNEDPGLSITIGLNFNL